MGMAAFAGFLFLLCAVIFGARLRTAPSCLHAIRLGAFLTPWLLLFGLACFASVCSIRANRALPTEKALVEKIRTAVLKPNRDAVLIALLQGGFAPALQDGPDYQKSLKMDKEQARIYAKEHTGEYAQNQRPFSLAELERSASRVQLLTGYTRSESEELLSARSQVQAEFLFDSQGHLITWHYENYGVSL